MSNIIQVIAEDSDELLNTGAYGAGALIRVQTSATATGAYADLSGTGSTPTILLVASDRTYTAYDPSGTSTSWYRTRYENAGATRLSDWSTVFQIGTPTQLCSIGQVKARININDLNDDALISEIINQVSDFIHNFTGRLFVSRSATYTFDTNNGYVLRIPMGIQAITSMGVNNTTHQPDSGGTYTTVTSNDYLLRPQVQNNTNGWPFSEVWISRGTLAGTITAFGNVQNGCTITGTFGFASVPPEIQSVAIDASVAAYQARQNGASGVIGSEDASITPWRNFFTRGSSQRQILERYRWIGIA